jgi:hypothetical protein
MDTMTVSKEQCSERFAALVTLIKHVGGEAQARVAAHLRAITGGKVQSLALYHVSKEFSDEAKFEEYANISSALGVVRGPDGKNTLSKPNWSKLQGSLGNGAKKAEADEPEHVQRADPLSAPRPIPATLTPEPTDASIELTPEQPPQPEPISPASQDLATLLAQAVQPFLKVQQAGQLDEGRVRLICQEQIGRLDLDGRIKAANLNGAFPLDRVRKLIADALSNHATRIELITPSGEVKSIEGLVHKSFETVLKMTRSRVASGHPVPVWLDGPPGGGKSHLMEQVARALDLEPYILAIGPTDTKTAIVGSVATGEFKPGIAYKPYKEGGLLGIDEIAAGDPGVLVSLNSLVANTSYRFPNGEYVPKHKDLHVIVADNTRGHGSAKGMIRNRLDAATLDRFAFLKVDYDEQLEAALCGNAAWATYVQKVRAYIASNSGESVYITPRACLNGAALLAGGLAPQLVADATVFKFCSPDLKNAIISSIGGYP